MTSERDLVRRIAARVGRREGVIVGIGDDAAVVDSAGPVVVTHDTLVENAHFILSATSLSDLGHKCIAVNLSDIAAMGAAPLAIVVGLGLPPGLLSPSDVDELYAGMEALCAAHGASIAGGDVTTAPALTIGVTAIGRVPPGRAPVLRSRARPGDLICVTGRLGAAACGLELVRDPSLVAITPHAKALLAAHRRPTPRITAGRVLAARGAHAMLDCSDGLAIDCDRLAAASGVEIHLRLEDVPIASGVAEVAAALGRDADLLAATGGDDYELVVALAPGRVEAAAAGLEIPLTVIGSVGVGAGVALSRNGVPVSPPSLGWEHPMTPM